MKLCLAAGMVNAAIGFATDTMSLAIPGIGLLSSGTAYALFYPVYP
jgi:hypothetical protein